VLAEQLGLTSYTDGDQKLVVTQDDPSCTPAVTVGDVYQLTGWYESTVPVFFVVYTEDASGNWTRWQTSPDFAPTSGWASAAWNAPPIGAGVVAVSVGMGIESVGTVTLDDLGLYNTTAPGGVTSPAGLNLILNPSLESSADGITPDCWQDKSWGDQTGALARVSNANSGSYAEQLSISSYTDGDEKLVTTQDSGACAPSATPGHSYTLSAWYHSTVPAFFVVYYRDSSGNWTRWSQSPYWPATSTWTQASYTTPPVPAGATALSVGLAIDSVGRATVDDYSLADDGTP
jgi:hypothetical protein